MNAERFHRAESSTIRYTGWSRTPEKAPLEAGRDLQPCGCRECWETEGGALSTATLGYPMQRTGAGTRGDAPC